MRCGRGLAEKIFATIAARVPRDIPEHDREMWISTIAQQSARPIHPEYVEIILSLAEGNEHA